jgi:hypothetical protein
LLPDNFTEYSIFSGVFTKKKDPQGFSLQAYRDKSSINYLCRPKKN